MKTIAFLLWYHAAIEAKNIEMNKELDESQQKCDTIQQELKETIEEAEKKELQLQEEAKDALSKKDRLFSCTKAIHSLSNVLTMNENRKKVYVFNRWNVCASTLKKEEEVRDMKDKQMNEEVGKLTQEHEEVVSNLNKEHSDKVNGLVAKHTAGRCNRESI